MARVQRWKPSGEKLAPRRAPVPIQRSPLDVLLGHWSLDYSPSYLYFDVLSRFASPYEFNPLNFNPLRDIVERTVDFEKCTAAPV
jgi:hypothetical protein